jgi:hypothetical protein
MKGRINKQTTKDGKQNKKTMKDAKNRHKQQCKLM